MIQLSSIDYLIISAYLVITLSLGLFVKKRHTRSAEDFVLAGRKLTLPAFVATLVSTWYGGILGVGEFTFLHGLVNWVTQGFFYYIFAAVFAFYIAPRIRKTNVLTIPDRLEQVYGRKAALTGSVFTFIMTIPAPYVLIIGVLFQVVFGWSLLTGFIIGATVSTLYLFTGGFRAVIRTDILQFVLMFTGFIVLVITAFVKLGGFEYLQSNLPQPHLTFTGELGTGYILVWGFVALWTLIDPGFYQRCMAAKDGRTARNGLLVSIGFWILFDALTCTAGLYARAALPSIDPLMAYPLLAEELLPAVLKGIFFAGMLATVMSTLDSFAFLSALTIGNDFIARLRKIPATDLSVIKFTRIGLIITAAGSVLVAWLSQSVIGIWYTLGTIAIPALLVPVLTAFTNRYRLRKEIAPLLMIFSSGTSCVSLLWGYTHMSAGFPSYPLGLEPMYPGLAVSLCFFIFGRTQQS